MAVTVTPNEIIVAALARSSKNRPGDIATNATELLQTVIRATRGLYAFAARINPLFFATTSTVTYSAPGWARPELAESLFRIENPDNIEVVVVPYDDRVAEVGKPALYRMGQVFRSAGNALDPVSGNLTFFYSKRPTSPANVSVALDSSWVESYNDLLILEVAIYVALKDGRLDEVAALKTERDDWARLFIAFLEHETANERRRFGLLRYTNTASIMPIGSLLAGGSTVGS